MHRTHHSGSFPIIIASFLGLGFVKIYILVLVSGKCYFVKVTFPAVLQSDKFMHSFWTFLCRELLVTNSPWDQAKKWLQSLQPKGKWGNMAPICVSSVSADLSRCTSDHDHTGTCFMAAVIREWIFFFSYNQFYIELYDENFDTLFFFNLTLPDAFIARHQALVLPGCEKCCTIPWISGINTCVVFCQSVSVSEARYKREFKLFRTVTENPWSMKCVLLFFTH